MKKIKHLMIWIGLLLSLVSCKDTMEAIGLGRDFIPAEGLVLNLQLTGNFNKSYFTKVDIREVSEIKLYSKSAKLLTTHPSSSYTLVHRFWIYVW